MMKIIKEVYFREKNGYRQKYETQKLLQCSINKESLGLSLFCLKVSGEVPESLKAYADVNVTFLFLLSTHWSLQLILKKTVFPFTKTTPKSHNKTTVEDVYL